MGKSKSPFFLSDGGSFGAKAWWRSQGQAGKVWLRERAVATTVALGRVGECRSEAHQHIHDSDSQHGLHPGSPWELRSCPGATGPELWFNWPQAVGFVENAL